MIGRRPLRLYLSSFLVGNRPDRLVSLAGSGARAALILNALDNAPAARSEWRFSQAQALQDLGFTTEEVDLRDYFAAPNRLAAALQDKGLLWINGGNAFLLRRAMRQSGFDRLIHDLLAVDRLVYAGFSAAACCAAPTLRGIEFVDDPGAEAEGYALGIVWDGLGLIDRNLAVHYRSGHSDAAPIEQSIRYYRRKGIPYLALSDGQALVVDGADTSVVG